MDAAKRDFRLQEDSPALSWVSSRFAIEEIGLQRRTRSGMLRR
jgi:hypothetical protein